MNTIEKLIAWGKAQLGCQDNSLCEAQQLLSQVLQCDKAWLYTWPQKELNTVQIEQFRQAIQRRKHKEPIHYIMGYREFWSHIFRISEHTLIPRSETELLVETVLKQLPKTPQCVAEVGTGSGIIACTLALMRSCWKCIATDISAQALEIARYNAYQFQLQRSHIEFVQTSWLQGLETYCFDAIVSNPPYIKEGDPHLTQGDLPFEPPQALVAGKTGLESFTAISVQAKKCLKINGLLAFEHGYDQALAVQSLLRQVGFHSITTLRDLAGWPRVTFGRRGK